MEMPIDEALLRVEDAVESDEKETPQLLSLVAGGDSSGGAIAAAAARTASDVPPSSRAMGDAGVADASPLPSSLFEFDETSALLFDLDLDPKSMESILDTIASEDERSVRESGTHSEDEAPGLVEIGLSKPVRDLAKRKEDLDFLQTPRLQSSAIPSARSGLARVPQDAFMYKGRKNTKLELEYLREQVQALEKQLGDLQQAAVPGSATLDVSSVFNPSPDVVWEQIAQRQKSEKQKAEIENAKLREMLQGQLKVASSLEKILRKRPNASWLETFELDIPDKKRFRLEDESEAADTFAILSGEIADLYAQLDSVLAETGLADKTHEDRDVQMKSDVNDHMFMELLDSKILPFDLSVSSAAVWKVAGISRAKFNNGHYGAIDSTDDTVHSQVSVSLHLRHAQVLIQIDMAVRKFVEADRVVMLWSSMGTSEGSLLGSHQIKIRERGWLVVKPVSNNSSLLQIVVRVAPELCRSVSAQDHQQAGVLTDLIMASYHQNINAIHQLIENSLLAEAGNQQNPCSSVCTL